MYIVIAIIAFGILIVVHELGHFTAAKLLGVRVNEFAIGMGPKLLKKQGKETLYTLRALPFGGFCAMEGEDGDSADERSFAAQKRWRRIVILAAGGLANLLAGFIIIVVIVSGAKSFGGTTITDFAEGFPYGGEGGLQVGDTLLKVNGERLWYREDVLLFLELSRSPQVDITLKRGEETITLERFTIEKHMYMTDGEESLRYGFSVDLIEATALEKLKYSFYTAMNYIRLVRVSIAQLINGAAGIRDLSGPVGIVDAMNDIGKRSGSIFGALVNIADFTAIIGINMAVLNLLPIPALDGGRIVFIFITWIIEKTTRKKLNPKYEGYIHTAVLALLMGLMVFTLVNDVIRIVNN